MSTDSPLLAQSPQAGYERSGAMRNQSRSVVMAKNGIVATSHPLAAQAGLDMLQAGGTAADAAIAANAMLGVVEPMSCGIGGDLFVIYWDNKTQKLYGLNGSGRSPYNISRQKLKDKELDEIPSSGPLSWSVPGCVDGWEVLRAKFGRKTLAESLQAAITTADEGFPVSEVIAAGWKGSVPSLKDWPDSTATYLINGERAPNVGEIFRNPNMAESYRKIAKQGRDAFYKGDIAKEIVAFSEKVGGYFRSRILRITPAPGSSRFQRTTAVTMFGNCRPTAKASPRCRC